MARVAAALAALTLIAVVTGVLSAGAQTPILPPPTQPPTTVVATTEAPPTTLPVGGVVTTAPHATVPTTAPIRRTTTSSTLPPTTTIFTVPTPAANPAAAPFNPAPKTGSGQISGLFGLLSGIGFAVVLAVLGLQWYLTRPGRRGWTL